MTAYTVERFERLYAEFLSAEGKLLVSKREEYAKHPQADCIGNFREFALMADVSDTTACIVLISKHLQGIRNGIGQAPWSWETGDGHEGLKQRIADARNYLLLLAALIDRDDPFTAETTSDIISPEGPRTPPVL